MERELTDFPQASPDVTDSEIELLSGDNGDAAESISPETEGAVTFSQEREMRNPSLREGMSLIDTTALVFGGIVGSGIFITPSSILENTGSFGVSMICWFAGMVLAMLGGLCYLELSLLIPRTGAEYVYILEGYSFRNRNKWTKVLGSQLAFLFTWAGIFIIRPASVSIVILTCVRYLTRPFYLECDIPQYLIKALAISFLLLHAFIVCRSVKLMAKINTVISLLKVLSIVFIVLVGVAGIIQRGHFPNGIRHPFQGSSISSASDVAGLALALYSVLWAFEGWSSIGYAVEEVKRPERNLPWALGIGLGAVSLCYFLVNLSFFSVLSTDDIIGTPAVALPFGEAVMGKAGLVVFPLLVALSTFGTSILNIYQSSRLVFSSAREGQFPEVFCGVHKEWGTPIASILLIVFTTLPYLVAGDISSLIEGFSAAIWVFYFLAFSTILIMRFTHREKRRFKVCKSRTTVWLTMVWWIVPVIAMLSSVFLIVLPLAKGPGWTLAAFIIILSGVPVYIVFVMDTPRKLRPAFLDKWSGLVTSHINRVIQAKSAR